MRKHKILLNLFVIAILFITSYIISSQTTDEGKEMGIKERRLIRAPELIGGTGWLNTDRPIYISDLKGKVVLLDFWTYGCINCMHVIPDLKKLESKYANELVVIGVHSAKFFNEGKLNNLRQAVLKYGIEHPVVNDSEFRIWRSYGVRAWPTLVLIDPDGYVVGAVSGEGHYELLDEVIGKLIEEFSKQNKIDRSPLKLPLEKHKVVDSPLSFPGKIIADRSGLIYISDSNNNRIIVSDTNGNVKQIIGTGKTGKEDGTFSEASFNKPQGLALDGHLLYVADTENHLIRVCNLKTKTVKTVAGTGKQARMFNVAGKALQTDLNSPWDLVMVNGNLFIAMAGFHQIWVLETQTGIIKPFAGSGREGILDGNLKDSELAQPSGITTDGKKLYIADSEASAIRSIDIDPNGKVETIVGVGLFEFGDVDGKGREARLQHPLGIVHHDGKLYVADTYNHKIKIIDPVEKTSETFLGTGNPGFKDGTEPEFYEPSGLTVHNNRIYIADTNNNAVRIAEIPTKTVSTLWLKGASFEDIDPNIEKIMLPPRKVRAGYTGRIVFNITFPPSFGLTEGAPMDYNIIACKLGKGLSVEKPSMIIEAPKLPLQIPFTTSEEEGNCLFTMDVSFNYCDKRVGTCSIKSLRVQVPVYVSKEEGDQRIMIEYKLKP